LDEIVETKRRFVREVAARVPLDVIRAQALAAPPVRDFVAAVVGGPAPIRAIAEMKRKSPSAGVLREPYDPAALARTYHRHGAAALSVLTDEPYFGGELRHLALAREATPLPVLRKEFIVDEYQVFEARACGADAILLIAAVLAPGRLAEFAGLARSLGLAVLVEVHTEAEWTGVADSLGPPRPERYLLGINNRDLSVQRTDLGTTQRLARLIPPGSPFVSESGIRTSADVARVQAAGARAILVGESLLRADDPGEQLAELLTGRARSD
jgi:indole-3-glycerol phosphate synthase